MDREEVYKMLDNEGILVERLKNANSQRKLKARNQQKHKRTQEGGQKARRCGSDSPRQCEKKQADKEKT
jgi:hypothetical protein